MSVSKIVLDWSKSLNHSIRLQSQVRRRTDQASRQKMVEHGTWRKMVPQCVCELAEPGQEFVDWFEFRSALVSPKPNLVHSDAAFWLLIHDCTRNALASSWSSRWVGEAGASSHQPMMWMDLPFKSACDLVTLCVCCIAVVVMLSMTYCWSLEWVISWCLMSKIVLVFI